jgi:hypothetical protein
MVFYFIKQHLFRLWSSILLDNPFLVYNPLIY